MKLLFISNIIGNRVGSFAMASIQAAKQLQIEYHMAANFNNSTKEQMKMDEEEYGIILHHIDFERNPIKPANIKAYKQIVNLINEEQFDVIHCNTPIGGVIGRLAGRRCGVKKVLYQAHGFHFYKGAPAHNWIVYYAVERCLAHYTDSLLTINREDYERALSFHLRKHGRVYRVPGVGLNTADYIPYEFDRELKRSGLGLKSSDIVIISAGDLIKRKNYKTAIKAVAGTADQRIKYIICGRGPLENDLKKLADKLGVKSQILFLGYRTDVKELLWASDIFLFTTYQEGLPRSLSEAMASGLPCIASDIRGNCDLIEEGKNGYLCAPDDMEGFKNAIIQLKDDGDLRCQMGKANKIKIKEFDFDAAQKAIQEVYEKELLS